MDTSHMHTAQQVQLPAGALPIPGPANLDRVSSTATVDQAIAELHANCCRVVKLSGASRSCSALAI
jgi:hypothetical protein